MMTRIPALAAVVGMALLTAPLPAQVRSQSAKSYSDRLAALNDLQRRGSLRHAILDSGEKCQSVSKAAYQGPYKNMEMWVARCGTTDYGAFIGPDGTVQVSTCTYLASVKWPTCRKLD